SNHSSPPSSSPESWAAGMPEHDTQYGTFDFGLTSEQEGRARRLHRDSLLVDLAFQGPVSPDAWTDVLHKELDEAMAARPGDVWVPFEFLQDKAVQGVFPQYRELFDASGVTCGQSGLDLRDRDGLLKAAVTNARVHANLPWLRPALRADDIRRAH